MTAGALVPASVAARLLGRDVRTIRAWIRRGQLSGARVGSSTRARWYVHRDALERLRRAR